MAVVFAIAAITADMLSVFLLVKLIGVIVMGAMVALALL